MLSQLLGLAIIIAFSSLLLEIFHIIISVIFKNREIIDSDIEQSIADNTLKEIRTIN